MKNKIKLLLIVLFALVTSLNAQNIRYSKSELEKSPVWIGMMEDTLTNFYDAQRAFETYWSIRPKPIEEEEIIGHSELKAEERKNRLFKIFALKKERREQEAELYAFEYKKFKNWERANLPYVQDDGSILTPSQRISILKEQRKK